MPARLAGAIRIPREPSVVGMLVVSAASGLVAARPPLESLVLAVAVLALHMLTFDSAMALVRSGRHLASLAIALVNGSPYIIAYMLGYMSAWPLGAAGLILALYFLIARARGWSSPQAYIAGAAIPVLPALLLPALATGAPGEKAVVLWLLLTLYSVSTAAYVESRLEFRRLDPRIPLATWIPSWILVAWNSLLLIALVEPTAKLLANLKLNVRVRTLEEIRKLGRRELVRLIVFVTLAVVSVAP